MGRLFVVPTPIGNLEDITYRAVRVLGEVDLILAEDTRHTRRLLHHFGIKTPLRSYHQHNKLMELDQLVELTREGNVALVSSAGMPAVSDPGFELIAAVAESGIRVEVLPGASAVITATVGAALPAPGFIFLGFLPRKSSERRRRLQSIATLPYTIVLYEAPHRLAATLKDLALTLGDRRIVLARELSKIHEEYVRGGILELAERYSGEQPRGEFTLVVEGGRPEAVDATAEAVADLRQRWERGVEARSAISDVMARYGLSRNQTYRLWLEVSSQEE